ncbi:MAG: glycosyltransferase family 4 protein [Methylomonas sp.]|jgi:glycosyltransferase involved in cell wall biosynthesis
MKIAYFINQYPKVSHSFIRREILELERQGAEIFRIALRGWDAEVIDTLDVEERSLTHYVLQNGLPGLFPALLRCFLSAPSRFFQALALSVKMGVRSDRPLPMHIIYFAEACQVTVWLRSGNLQHIHAHFGTNSAEVAMLAHVLSGLPYSFTVHGPEEFDKPEFLGLPEKMRRAEFVIAISSFGRSQLYRWLNHAGWSKIKVVHCALEKTFYEETAAEPEKTQRLICVGRLSAQKGQLLLLEAMALLANRGIVFDLVLAGDGEMRREIEALIAKSGLQERVLITGWISCEQVREALLAAKALILPSFAEGLPVVIMEAMALRRPVLSTYVAGIPELVSPGENGWLVPAGCVESLAEAIAECLGASEDTLRNMGEANRRKVIERHSVEVEAAKLHRLFAESISKQRVV